MYFVSSILNSKGLHETCTQGSSGQHQLFPSFLHDPVSRNTIPSFNKRTLASTWTSVLKFFLYESSTWRSPDTSQRSRTVLGQDQPLLSCSSPMMRRPCSSSMAHPVSWILQQSWNFWFSRRIGVMPSFCWQEALPSGRVETKHSEKKPEVKPLAEGISKGDLWWIALRFVWRSASGAGSLQDGWDRNRPLGGKSHLPSWIPKSTFFFLLAIFQSTENGRQ